MTKRYVLCDRNGRIVEGPYKEATDFQCNWTPDRELVVVHSDGRKVGDVLEVVQGEEKCD